MVEGVFYIFIMKRFLLFIFFLVSIFLPIFSVSSQSGVFIDVPAQYPFSDAVFYLENKDVVQGYDDSNFRPDQTINRAEFLKMVMGSLDSSLSGSNCFSDVASEWFAQYVCSAKENGIIEGYGDGSFRPSRNISFVEASKVISKAFALDATLGDGSVWYESYVRALEDKKAIPVSIDYFEKSVTRGEVAEILYRLNAKKQDRATKIFTAMNESIPRISSCAELEDKLKIENYKNNYRYGSLRFFDMAIEESAAPPTASGAFTSDQSAANGAEASSYSQTNVQVLGVDEGDVMKNDGKYIYFIADNKIRIVDAYPPQAMRAFPDITFEDTYFRPYSLYLDGSSLVIIGMTSSFYTYDENPDSSSSALIYPPSYSASLVRMYVYDVSNPADPVKVRETEFEGSFISSRKIDDRVYLVIRSEPVYSILEDVSAQSLVPKFRDSATGEEGPIVPCNEIVFFPRYENPSFLTVASVPLTGDEKYSVQKEVFLGAGDTVYASLKNLYVALHTYDYNENVLYNIWDPPKVNEYTSVYRFALDNGNIEYKGLGRVSGRLHNQYSLDEYDGNLRLATTTGDLFGSGTNVSRNHLYILDIDNLQTVRGKVSNIAPGETIYSVRFLSGRAYMVTFKKIDPFFVIDVSDPDNPKILGNLKISGYSDYLHPYDENHILAFGKEAVEPREDETFGRSSNFTWYQGMKIAIFDVTDVKNPKEMFKEVIGDRGTESELLQDPKALLFDPSKELLSFPISVAEIPGKEDLEYTGSEYGQTVFSGAYVYTVNLEDGFKLRGNISHVTDPDAYQKQGYAWYDPYSQIRRILYMDDYLYAVSNGMVSANTLDTVSSVNSVRWLE